MQMLLVLIIVAAVIAVALMIYHSFFRSRSEKTDLSMLPEKFAVIDIETTGLDSAEHEIIEIAAVMVNRDSTRHETFTALVKPEKKLPKKITELTGITNEMLDREGERLNDAMLNFLHFVGNSS